MSSTTPKLISTESVDNGDGTYTVTDTYEMTRTINVADIDSKIEELNNQKLDLVQKSVVLKSI